MGFYHYAEFILAGLRFRMTSKRVSLNKHKPRRLTGAELKKFSTAELAPSTRGLNSPRPVKYALRPVGFNGASTKIFQVQPQFSK